MTSKKLCRGLLVFPLSVAALGASLACSATHDNSGFGGAGSGTSSGHGGELAVGGSFGEGGGLGQGGGSTTDDCAESAKLIYLLSVENSLWSFNPTVPGLGAYQHVGTLNCQASGSPQSMSVDRGGRAWVFFDSGQMFHVSTVDTSC